MPILLLLDRIVKRTTFCAEMNGFVLIAGDQVLEWNGVPLTGKTFAEVQMLVSQTEGEVELVVKR
jgi:hypothetical protein